MMLKFMRVLKILRVALRYGLDEIVISGLAIPRSVRIMDRLLFWRDLSAPRGERLRLALEELGPIFVKFGQVLSTRRDLMPMDIADELAHLQDMVPSCSPDVVLALIIRSLGARPDGLLARFDGVPVACASSGQVHFAQLHNGREVAVRVLRPDIKRSIDDDVALMHIG